MTTKLDHLYGASGDITAIEGRLAAVETKATNLGNITVKNNVSNQVIPQQRINSSPTDGQHIVRLGDTQFIRIVNQTSALNNPNTVWEFTPAAEIVNQRLHQFRVKVGVSGVDYIFDVGGWIQDRNYKNMFPIQFFAKDDNFNESAKFKVFIQNNKFKMMSTVAVSSVIVYMKVDNHR